MAKTEPDVTIEDRLADGGGWRATCIMARKGVILAAEKATKEATRAVERGAL